MRRKKYSLVILLSVAMMLLLTACSKTSNVKQSVNLGSDTKKTELTVLAVVKAIDTQAQTITLYDTDTQEEQNFEYNGGTQVLSKNKVQMLMSQLTCGEIVEASYDPEQHEVTKVQISKNAWEYKKVKALDIDRSQSIVTLTGRKYQYESDLCVFYGDQEELLIDVNNRDEVTVKGIGDKVYSLQITKGHGYIRFGGHDKFVGGSLEVDQNIFLKVEENMLVTVGEGEHTVVFRKGDMQAVETVTVERDKETFLDMSQYEPEKGTKGKVRFVITPSDAVLYVNGKVKNQNNLISLAYGNYAITVKADGYKDYTGILRVQESSKKYETVYIDLAAEDEDSKTTATPSTTTSPTTTPSSTATSNTTVATATPTPSTDSNCKISIKEPEGASVYVNGVYKGVAPISFTKIIGDLTITLSKTGYVTKSYSVTIDDDSEDVEYSFADLVAEED